MSQQVIKRFRWEGDLNRQTRFVLGEGHHIELRLLGPLKPIEALANETLHDLARSIRSEVEHQQRVAVFEVAVGEPDGFHELIGDVARVARLKGLSGRERTHRQDGVGQQVIGLFRALPALISVHGPVAAAQAHDLADATRGDGVLDLVQVNGSALGGRVASIGDHMDGDIVQSLFSGPLEQSAEVIHMAVNAAVGAESEQMKGSTLRPKSIGQGLKAGDGAQLLVADRIADSNQFLANDPSGANGEVADFGVTHLAIGQAHMGTTGLNQRLGIRMPQCIHHRGFG